ncbi:MAG: right-handed parallel beta-helix repeat-containing protein [Candidatus Omnitrophota bacterium]
MNIKRGICFVIFAINLFIFLSDGNANDENITNNIDFAVKKFIVPTIPMQIEEMMEYEIPKAGTYFRPVFNWFYFYDPYLNKECKAKFNGWSSPHFHSWKNRSVKFNIENEDNFKLKALGSEVFGFWNITDPFVPYEQVFSEFVVYTLASQYYELVPRTRLLNVTDSSGKSLGHRILWDDNFRNSFTDNLDVIWGFFAYPDSERLLKYYWKSNLLKGKKGKIKSEFMDLLREVVTLSSIPRSLQQSIAIDDVDYTRYLALNTIFNSCHMTTHNLIFVAQEEEKNETTFNLALNDLMGMNFITQNPITYNLNYISEYFMRNPYWMHNYFQDVQFLCNEILGKRKISYIYDEILAYSQVLQEELLDIGSVVSVPQDINNFIQSVEQIKSFETIRQSYIKGALSSCTLKWQILNNEISQKIYLVLNVPSPVGVYLDKVEYKDKNVTSDWQLSNPPWWHKEKNLLLPEWIRIRRPAVTQNIIEPTRYLYFYEYQGKDINSKDNLKLTLRNAVTGEPIIPVYDPKPKLIVNIAASEDNIFSKKLTVSFVKSDSQKYPQASILNPEDSDWDVKVFSNGLSRENKPGEYVIDFSETIKQSPIPLTYEVVLYYKGMRMDNVKGEVFIEYQPQIEKPQLTMKEIQKYKISEKKLKELATYTQLQSMVKKMDDTVELKEYFNTDTKIYFIPGNSQLIVMEDIILGKNDLLILGEGVKLQFLPVKKLEAGYILAKKSQFIAYNQIWAGIAVFKNVIFDEVIVNGVGSGTGLELRKETVSFINNSTFDLNNIDIKSDPDSVLVINNSNFSGSKKAIVMNENRVKLSELTFSSNLYSIKAGNCVGEISGIKANDIASRIFWFKGVDTKMALTNITVKNAPYFLIVQDNAQVSTTNVFLENIGCELLDMDYGKWQDIGSQPVVIERFRQQLKSTFNIDDIKAEYLVVIKKGVYTIEENLIVPKGYIFEIKPGTTFKFKKGISLVSYGCLQVIGSQSEPIVFTNSESKKSWGVVGLIQSKASGNFENCIFENGSEANINGTYFSGMLSGYYCDVKVENCIFRYASKKKGDDALNFKYGTSVIKNSYFYKNNCDAVDFDCMKAGSRIEGCYFYDNGNDGIDISGSETFIFNNRIEKSGDKGISFGEQSQDEVFNNIIIGCNLGVAVKDLSQIRLINNTIVENNVGVTAYCKKRFFGGGNLIVYNSLVVGNKLDFGIENREDKGVKKETSVCIVSNSAFELKNKKAKILIKEPKLKNNKNKKKGKRKKYKEIIEGKAESLSSNGYEYAKLLGNNITSKEGNISKGFLLKKNARGNYHIDNILGALGNKEIVTVLMEKYKLKMPIAIKSIPIGMMILNSNSEYLLTMEKPQTQFGMDIE